MDGVGATVDGSLTTTGEAAVTCVRLIPNNRDVYLYMYLCM